LLLSVHKAFSQKTKELQKLVGKYKGESKDRAEKLMDPYGEKAVKAADDEGVALLGEGGEGGYVQPRGPRSAAAAADVDGDDAAEKPAPKAKAKPAAKAAAGARPAAKRAAGGPGAGAQRRPRPGGKPGAKAGAARPKARQRMVQRPLEMEVEDERPARDNLHPMRMEL
jgi:hypothetical protein